MSKTRVIAIADVKGGVGKTTTTMNLAGLLARRGNKVTVLDTDNTGGSLLWDSYVRNQNKQMQEEAARNGTTVPEYTLGFDVVPATEAYLKIGEFRNRYEGYVFIDTPPSDTDTIRTAIEVADVTIIPCQPSVSDVTHAGKTYSWCPPGRGLVLLTRYKSRTKLADAAVASLDSQGVPRFDTVIREREFIKSLYGTNRLDMQDYDSVATELVKYMDQLEEVESIG
ncbi:ParA family protein [Bifidobacterium sp. SO1]|uniref:ParA family protein n=1 Tax=Bifidobacterium sp. SO1 TaxID=2809029 RepID=UPI001BDC1F69|nr:ParA family protein [Bifidobacterium sp. SO1]MBT1162141.1 ParA family protein [Bifidobacterium sp. SO1]